MEYTRPETARVGGSRHQSEVSGIARHSARVRLLAAAVVVAALVAILPSQAAAAVAPNFTINGTGYGHGMGLSQLGAVEAAKRGLTAEQIIKHYYTNVALTTIDTYRVFVNLWPGATSSNKGKASWTVRPGYADSKLIIDNVTYPDVTGGYTFTSANSVITMTWTEGGVRKTKVYDNTVSVKHGPKDINDKRLALVQVVDKSGGYGSAGTANVRYRGWLYVIVPTNEPNEVTLRNYLDDVEWYLYGVVPRELGSSFSPLPAASQAQAIAARSYVYQSRAGELYCTTRSQVYGGHSYFSSEANRNAGTAVSLEQSGSNAAVDATKGKHVTYGGKIVTTYFSASNGTATAQNEDIWGGTPLGYLRSVKDPYFVATSSTKWTVNHTGLTLGAQLSSRGYGPTGAGTSVWVQDVDLTYGAGGYPNKAVVSWSNGSLSTISPGQNVYLAFGLKSPQFTIENSLTATKYEETHAGISLVGPWTRSVIAGNSGGAIFTSKTKGAYFAAKFTGEGIRWIGPKSSTYGRAIVYVDGVLKTTVNAYRSTTARQQLLYEITGLDPDVEHEIKVVITTKVGSSLTGYVALDRLDVLGGNLIAPPITAFEENSAIVSKSSGWSTFTSGSMLGGAAIYTTSLNKTVAATFKGNEVRLYGYTGASGGRAKLYLDGKYVKTISYRSTTTVTKKLLFYKGSLDPTKTHTIKLVTIARAGSTRAGRVTFDRVSVTGYTK